MQGTNSWAQFIYWERSRATPFAAADKCNVSARLQARSARIPNLEFQVEITSLLRTDSFPPQLQLHHQHPSVAAADAF